MVARRHSPETLRTGIAGRAFSAWRRLLTRVLELASPGAPLTPPGDRGQEAAGGTLRRPGVTWLGLACLLGGVALRLALAPEGAGRAIALLASLATLLWAVVRLAILALTVRRLHGDTVALRGAWALGLAPWLLAVTPALTVFAWLASALTTFVSLERMGEDRRDARRSVVLAWGAHAAFGIIAWVIRNAWVALLAG